MRKSEVYAFPCTVSNSRKTVGGHGHVQGLKQQIISVNLVHSCILNQFGDRMYLVVHN